MSDQAPGAAGQGTEPTGGAAAALANPPAAAAAPAPAPNWLEGADEVTVGYVQNKGWEKPTQVLESYRNLEKLMGADRAGNTVILPKPDASPEEVGKFFDRLGRPADAAGYKIAVPEGGDPEFAKTAGSWFHELGLTAKQGEALAAKWNEYAGSVQTQHQTQTQQQIQADELALRTEWGAAHTQNLAAAQAAARGLGMDEATINKLEASLGYKGTMELFHKIGSKMGESEFVSGNKTEKFGSAMTPGQAQAQIRTLMADKNYVARYLSKDASAVAEMQRLHEFAYPEG